MRARSLSIIALVSLMAAAGCEQRQAYGDPNAIVIGMPEARWNDTRDVLQQGLQPTIFTVRDEATFRMTWKDPVDPDWSVLRQFRQVLVVGSPEDEWLADAVARARRSGAELTPPTVVQVRDVWARGQVVSLMLVSPDAGVETIGALADSLQTLLDGQFRSIARSRMFASGHHDSLTVQLERDQGFTFDLPRVYYWDRQDSTWIFRNDNPDPSELIRQVAVTWRSPIPAELPGEEELVAWRQELVDNYYQFRQITELAGSELSSGRLDGRDLVQLQASWANPPEEAWPEAGPLTVRAVACPEQDRLYLIDAWLFAPGQDKYQYMIQLETILNSFRCTDRAVSTPPQAGGGGAPGA